ncbi:MAG TPA: VanZ family protein [Actinomycetota bacterium]|nr:VanZ family protein [Actinomycetota bacterium]
MTRVLRQVPSDVLPYLGAVAVLTAVLALLDLRRGRPVAEAWGLAALDGGLVAAAVLIVLVTLSSRGAGRSVDLRPFQELGPVLRDPGAAAEQAWWAGANVLLFVPLGLLLPLRAPALDGWGRILLAGAVASAAVELLQFGLGMGRTAAVDDVLTNTAGAGLGYALLAAGRAVLPRRTGRGPRRRSG